LFYFVEGGVVDVDEDLMDEIGAEGLVAVAAGQNHFECLGQLVVIDLFEGEYKLRKNNEFKKEGLIIEYGSSLK